VSYEDREEIVNDSILKALESFDSEKGSFESLCRVILKNKIINFKRDNRELFFLIALDDYEEILSVEEILWEEKESNELAARFLDKLKSELEDIETKLFNEVYASCGAKERINITMAAENIGIDPGKAWDTFRKIQRKANKLYKNMQEKGEDVFIVPLVSGKKDVSYYRDVSEDFIEVSSVKLQKDVYVDDGYEKFFAGLNKHQIERINLIYENSEN
jgi:hypothetical protein